MSALATESGNTSPEIPVFLELEITQFCQLKFFWINWCGPAVGGVRLATR